MEKQVTFAVKGFIVKDGKFLIVKRNPPEANIWELPGGHLEYGETAEETIIREMNEETGLNVTPIKLMDTWDSYLPPNRQITGIIYRCITDIYEVHLSDEHCDFRWVEHESDDFNLIHPAFKDKMMKWDWTLND
ncbi:MAG: NUDIX domain-containing protein [Spirochaetales bacterium]|nr:NUDIX domain-containing protein [Spirochaetales bacterium]